VVGIDSPGRLIAKLLERAIIGRGLVRHRWLYLEKTLFPREWTARFERFWPRTGIIVAEAAGSDNVLVISNYWLITA
jgi:hypothetical protein